MPQISLAYSAMVLIMIVIGLLWLVAIVTCPSWTCRCWQCCVWPSLPTWPCPCRPCSPCPGWRCRPCSPPGSGTCRGTAAYPVFQFLSLCNSTDLITAQLFMNYDLQLLWAIHKEVHFVCTVRQFKFQLLLIEGAILLLNSLQHDQWKYILSSEYVRWKACPVNNT